MAAFFLALALGECQEVYEGVIMKTSAFHSIKATVHHDNTSCNTGNNIEKENLRSGTGGKPKCSECARL